MNITILFIEVGIVLLHYSPARYSAGWAALPTWVPVPDHRPSLDKRGEEVKRVKGEQGSGRCCIISASVDVHPKKAQKLALGYIS